MRLLDEPGLSLHGKAQADLLRYFDEKLAPHHQIIYSTHSPHGCVRQLLSARIVEDRVEQKRHRRLPIRTKVREDVLSNDPDTLFPLQGVRSSAAGHRRPLPAAHVVGMSLGGILAQHARVIAPPSAREAVAEAAAVDATEGIICDPALTFEMVAGTKADEFALIVSRADGATLILNDILSYVRHPHGIGAHVMARLLGFGVKRPRTSRPVRRMFVNDPAAVARQFRAWAKIPDLRRIIVSHGDVIERAPGAALGQAADDY